MVDNLKNEIVLFSKDIKTIPDKLADLIYEKLPDAGKQYVDNFLNKNCYTKAYVIFAIYFRLYNRQRMYLPVVKAVKTYIKKYNYDDLYIDTITNDVFYIDIDDNGREKIFYSNNYFNEGELLSVWKNCISVANEVEKTENKPIEIDSIIEKPKNKLFSFNKLKKQIIRKILKIKSKEVRLTEKEFKKRKKNATRKTN